MVTGKPLDHIVTTRHIKKVKQAPQVVPTNPAMLTQMAEPQHLKLHEHFDRVLRFCLFSGEAEYLDSCDFPDAGDLMYPPGFGPGPIPEYPFVDPSVRHVWQSLHLRSGGYPTATAPSPGWGIAARVVATPSVHYSQDAPPLPLATLDMPAIADRARSIHHPPAPSGRQYPPINIRIDESETIGESELIIRRKDSDPVYWDQEIEDAAAPLLRGRASIITGVSAPGLSSHLGQCLNIGPASIHICYIASWPRWHLGPSDPRRETFLPFSQYISPHLSNRCMPIALGWCALAADGADPSCEWTLRGAFGTASHLDYPPGTPPYLEEVVRMMGIFFGTNTATFDLHARHGDALLDRLLEHGGPLAVVACSLGAAFGFYARSRTVLWSFDSHSRDGKGACTRRWSSITEMVANVLVSACSDDAITQFTVFRPH